MTSPIEFVYMYINAYLHKEDNNCLSFFVHNTQSKREMILIQNYQIVLLLKNGKRRASHKIYILDKIRIAKKESRLVILQYLFSIMQIMVTVVIENWEIETLTHLSPWASIIFCCESCKQSEWNTQLHCEHFSLFLLCVKLSDLLLLRPISLEVSELMVDFSYELEWFKVSPGCPHILHTSHRRQIHSALFFSRISLFPITGKSSACRQNKWYGSQQTAHHSISSWPETCFKFKFHF